MGVKAGDRVAIISENRPEWSFVDLAILSLRAVNVPIYTTQAVEQIRFILENSGAKMLFISGKKLWKHAENAIQSVEQLEKLVFLTSTASQTTAVRSRSPMSKPKVMHTEGSMLTWSSVRSPRSSRTILLRSSTSGTTGEPKGVMLTHDNFVSNVVAVSKGLPIKSTDRSLAVLPLSHIFERTCFFTCSARTACRYITVPRSTRSLRTCKRSSRR
ncbi:MAG: AMP-binding protein [Acidobacteria bacterium]|nr:AMP-binding protein [Acidobacteriota bacterium]